MKNNSNNIYIVEFRDTRWEFDHVNKAMDFMRAMILAEGNIDCHFFKYSPYNKDEVPELFPGTAEELEAL